MTVILKKLAFEIGELTAELKTFGWDRTTSLRLLNILECARDEAHRLSWIEVLGRTQTLISLLNEFVREPPTHERFAPVLHSAHNLSIVLMQQLAFEYLENLPLDPSAWTFLLMEDVFEETSPLCKSLRDLGFVMEQMLEINPCDDRYRSEQIILLADANWIINHAALLADLHKQNLSKGFASPTLVAFVDNINFQAQTRVLQIGAQLVLDLSVTTSTLLTELAGLAWAPRRPYRALIINDDVSSLANDAQLLREAGITVAAYSDPLTALVFLDDAAPEVLVLKAAASVSQNIDFAALCRRQTNFTHLPVIYLTNSKNSEPLLNEFLSGETCHLVKSIPAEQLVSSALAKARQFRLFKTQFCQRQDAQKQLELLRNTLDTHSIVSIAAADGTIIDVNQKFCDISGYTKEELIGRNHRIVKSGHHPREFFTDMWQTIASGKVWHGEIQNRTKNGKPYWVQSTIVPITDAQDRPKQYFSIRTDVTHQKQMQAEGKRKERLLNLLRQALQDYNLNQDFKNTTAQLLDGILLLTESAYGFIAEQQHDPQGNPYLKINAMTDITWDESSRHRYQEMPSQGLEFRNLDTLYGAVLRSGEPIIANDPPHDPLSRGLPPGHPPLNAFIGIPLYHDKTLVGMVGLANRPGGYDEALLEFLAPFLSTCANLIETARTRHFQQQAVNDLARSLEKTEQALSNKTGFITNMSCQLRTLLNTISGHSQLLLMQDNQSASTHEEAEEIVKAADKLADLIDKLIEQTSDDIGTTDDDLPNTLLPVCPEEPKPEQLLYRILVAEDNPANQAVLKMQLNALGIEAYIAKSGTEALSQWKTDNYDLILTDLNMPDMDGLELARSIRAAELETGMHLPIIAITAVHYPEDLIVCLQAGIDDTLSKPIELDKLRQMLLRWLPLSNNARTLSLPTAISVAPAITSNNKPVLDTGYLARITGSMAPDQIRSLVDLFTTSARADLCLCCQQIQQKDTQALALSMHKLKSSARTVGALRFAELSENLEAAARKDSITEAISLLMELENGLSDVENAIINQSPLAATESMDMLTLPGCVLVVDDDAVVRRQITLMLTALGVSEVLAADSGIAGLKEVERHGNRINMLLCDLNMPEMDGIEFLRRMSEIRYQGGIILVSGVDDRLLQTAVELASLQGLRLYGSVGKPLTREALIALLNEPCDKLTHVAQKVAVQSVVAADILEGLHNNEFEIYFQPKVDASTLRPVGVEALARWRRQGVVIAADAFILAAEHHNLIAQLSEVLLIKAFIGGARIIEAGFPLSVAINLSAQWLSDVNLPDFIQASLHATGLKVENVILEITETGVMADLTKALDIMTRLRLKGFRLSIDDFGTGYSSMEQLQRIPFSELKLDRTFVQGAADNATARTILSASVKMASKLKLTTVAEGVETQEDLDLMRGMGCDLIQGWFIARPMPFDELIDWLRVKKIT